MVSARLSAKDSKIHQLANHMCCVSSDQKESCLLLEGYFSVRIFSPLKLHLDIFCCFNVGFNLVIKWGCLKLRVMMIVQL